MRIPGARVLADKVPDLATTPGRLRAAGTHLAGVVGVPAMLRSIETASPFLALAVQLGVFVVTGRLLASLFRGGQAGMAYAQAFWGRFLPATGLNVGSLAYILLNGGGAAGATAMRLVPGWAALLLGGYLAATALALLVRSLEAAGLDTLSIVYVYYPDEGRRVDWSVYQLLRHPTYAAMDRLALAFGLWNGSAYALLLAVVFVFVWHPVWYGLEEEELLERFGDSYRTYRDRVPAVMPRSLAEELALLRALSHPVS